MDLNENSDIVIEGMEDIITRDLSQHKALVERTKGELDAFRTARSHEVKKKRYYASLIGTGKYDDDALRSSMGDIAINIRHLSDKAELAEKKMAHHTRIVDELTAQLSSQNAGLVKLAEYRRTHASTNRLV